MVARTRGFEEFLGALGASRESRRWGLGASGALVVCIEGWFNFEDSMPARARGGIEAWGLGGRGALLYGEREILYCIPSDKIWLKS